MVNIRSVRAGNSSQPLGRGQGQSHIAPAQQPLPDDVTRRLDSLENLPPRSINSYTEMASTFATKFSIIRLIRKTTSEVMRVRQRDGESLKNFMSRFNDAVLEVSSFDQAVGIIVVISGLSHERFRDSLLKHPATTFNEETDEDSTKSRSDVNLRTEIRKTELYTPQQSEGKPPVNWTPFNLPRSQIFIQIKNKMDLRRPGPMRTAATSRDHTRYCDFHQDHGHTTKQCNSLREQRPQPQGIRNPPNRQGVGYQQTPPPLPPPVRIIHMITKGLEAGGLSSKQRKLYVREVKHQNRAQKRKFDDAEWKNQPIIFTSADLDTVVTTHNDPLVTSVMINNCEVQRVLVDTGSAPNIMYFHCFESLGLDPALLQKYDGLIYGFNNQPVPVEGVLTMNVAFESGRNYVTPSVRFLVVKMASSFNIVIGRPTLTEIRAVTPEVIPQQIPDNQQVMGVEIVDNRPEDETRATPVEDVEEVLIDDRDPSRKMQIGTRLNPEERAELIAFLRANNDVFAWTSADMPRIPPLVPMALEDEEKISFYAGDEIYCYVMMPFGLKNAGATYQKMVTIVFRAQIGRNIEVYVDDIVVKNLKVEDHLADLDETFNNLRKNRMRLNPAKCIFGVESGKFLGFMVSRKGIEVNPEKIRAIAEMEPPKSVKDIQRLTGRVAALHRFISKSANKYLPFFKIMSSVLHGAELRYPIAEKAALAVVTSARKLRPYFQSHPIIVFTDQPLWQILQKPRCFGRLIKWVVKLGEFEITFQQRSTIRAQALVDFIVECTPCPSTPNLEPNDWTLYVDGACSSKGSGAGALLIGPDGYNSLSKFASDSSLSSRSVFVEVLDEPSLMKSRMMEISTDPDTPSWTDSIISFLRDGIISEDRPEAMKLRKKASRYTLVDGVLYKRSFSLILLRCLNPYEAEYALREVHEGVCGSHVGARTLAHKVLRQGYYWPNMYKDAIHFVQKCSKCPFMKGVGGVTHLIVGIDYFTKWVEARPLSSLTSKKVKDFFFSSIICRYGISNQIVADNGTQFNCSSFRDFCSSYGIKLQFTSVYHPESNGMVESVKKCILEGIKSRLEQHKAKWADELNNILLAYRTTSRTVIGETPYHLAFGTEAVIPIEIRVPSFRVTHFDEGQNGQLLRENLDLLAEVREEAGLRTLVYK
ncbi:hypothetical protein SLEP1_g3685 [Rubroshorea leprosula]|uniref:RNA-directed DNA polymerase n=1 Tax=Rubroshorea leprosula TaxID=152421 RepID=A0AAV5HWQ3_9ROSI|nr:hypothetical protein SLEP1_g3685 [Rubroshorea leprosula]